VVYLIQLVPKNKSQEQNSSNSMPPITITAESGDGAIKMLKKAQEALKKLSRELTPIEEYLINTGANKIAAQLGWLEQGKSPQIQIGDKLTLNTNGFKLGEAQYTFIDQLNKTQKKQNDNDTFVPNENKKSPTSIELSENEKAIIELIKHFESSNKSKTKAYLCPAGIPTIGNGTTIYPDGQPVKIGDTCTEEEAETYFMHDYNRHKEDVDNFLQEHQLDYLPEKSKLALVSFSFNLGIEKLNGSKCLQAIKNKNYTEAEIEFSDREKGFTKIRNPLTKKLEILDGLVARRQKEWEFFMQGINQANNN
jgi:lysozyme